MDRITDDCSGVFLHESTDRVEKRHRKPPDKVYENSKQKGNFQGTQNESSKVRDNYIYEVKMQANK